jgi:hypothetical protein
MNSKKKGLNRYYLIRYIFSKSYLYNILMILVLFIFVDKLTGQENTKVNKFKISYGLSLLGNGDLVVNNYVNEYSRLITPKVEAAINFTLGMSSDHIDRKFSMNFFQSNLNLKYQIIDFSRSYNIKIGSGISAMDYSIARYAEGILVEGYWLTLGEGENYFNFGFNLLFENEFRISSNLFLNLSVLGQFYSRPTNQNIGVFLMLGHLF